MSRYFILMGDIKNSRKFDSNELSKIMIDIISNSQKKFENSTLSKLEVKVGDDFQVVMKDIKTLLQMLFYLDISFLSKNIECRFALGYGTISGEINKNDHSRMLGSGLTNINEILDKKEKKYSFYIEDEIYKTILLNSIGTLLEDCLSNLTDKQKDFLYYKVVQNKNLKEIEELMHIKQRAVYYFAERSKYILVTNIFEHIELSFENDTKKLEKTYFKDLNLERGNSIE
ncbi:SatD family protein [Halarcobacter ebronensis]|uniref:SatD family protein n=1 Tax=Halarcobacter ebronensis TaxID=1462615 RepID=UPI00155D8ECA|nr:SatD family protein [Halarcobacter ebronensis]QKF82852.1 SatD family protein [Halarcobacter ebronensis]